MKKSRSDGISLRRTLAEILVNFLLGAAWAVALLGAVYFFWSFLPFGIPVALAASIAGSLVGLFMVLFLEVVNLQFEKFRLMRRQTELLESIEKKLDDTSIRDNRP
ncbi:MAG: hypothetical protein L3J42_07025 [Hydrogenimonas sp.]|nr:hypothetical protein [Hydrogenimonas sp.]